MSTALSEEAMIQILAEIAKTNPDVSDKLNLVSSSIVERTKSKRSFVADTNHEMRTPLNAMVGYAALLKKNVQKINCADPNQEIIGKVGNHLDMLEQAYKRLQFLIGDVLDFSKIADGVINLKPRKFSLLDQTQKVANEMDALIGQHGRSIILPESNPAVIADQGKVCQVLYNLLGNAEKFTPKDGVIRTSFVDNGDFVQTVIENEGLPIPDDVLPIIFDPYCKGRGKRSGTGLGLTISQKIVRAHHGQIGAENLSNGNGVKFWFTLPKYHTY